MLAETVQKTFKTLSDPTRVRILALLEREELAVQELVEVLGMAQPRVSSHLRLLREAGWVEDRRQGTSVFYKFVSPVAAAHHDCWSLVRRTLSEDADSQRDAVRAAELVERRADRSRAFFDSVGAEWDSLRSIFNDDALRARAINQLVPQGLKVVEIGTGTGIFAFDLMRLGVEVIAVDRSPAMLRALQGKAAELGLPGVELHEADASDLPFGDGEMDAAFAHMVLRYLPRPARAIQEMARVTRPGGAVVLIDFVRHECEWMYQELGVQWLGFTEQEVNEWFAAAGLKAPSWSTFETRSRGRDLPATFIASGVLIG